MQVDWSQRAEDDFTKQIGYLEENVSRKAASDYMELVVNTLERISNQQVAYQLIDEEKRIRRCRVNKHINLYYKEIADDHLVIITLFDTRQNPDKLAI